MPRSTNRTHAYRSPMTARFLLACQTVHCDLCRRPCCSIAPRPDLSSRTARPPGLPRWGSPTLRMRVGRPGNGTRAQFGGAHVVHYQVFAPAHRTDGPTARSQHEGCDRRIGQTFRSRTERPCSHRRYTKSPPPGVHRIIARETGSETKPPPGGMDANRHLGWDRYTGEPDASGPLPREEATHGRSMRWRRATVPTDRWSARMPS
jgi:hypothetical protein